MKPTFCSIIGCKRLARHSIALVVLGRRLQHEIHVCDGHLDEPGIRSLVSPICWLVLEPFEQRRPVA